MNFSVPFAVPALVFLAVVCFMIMIRVRATVTVFDQIEKQNTTFAQQAAVYIEILQRMKGLSALIGMRDVRERLSIAGDPVSLDLFQTIRLLCVIAAFLAVVIAIVFEAWYALLLVVLVKVPDIWLSMLISNRRSRMKREFLQVATRFSTAFAAGLDTKRALKWASSNISSRAALRDELNQVLVRLETGAPLNVVLNEFSARTQLLDARRLSTMLIQAETYGLPGVSDKLLELVRDARERRKSEIIGEAKTADQKLQLAILLMALPTVICTLGALLISMSSQGGF